MKDRVMLETYYSGPQERAARLMGVGTYAPVHFSQLDEYFRTGFPCNVVVFSVSPPDDAGWCNLGTVNPAIAYDLLQPNPRIILQINEQVPYIYGEDNFIHISWADMLIELNEPPGYLPQAPATDVDNKIADHIIDLIPDGACIQIGVGTTANAVSYKLEGKKDLGVHTEMITESMIYLAQKGVINGSKKQIHKHQITSGLMLGSQAMYDFCDRNPMIHLGRLSQMLKPHMIAANDNFISLNNTLQVDLTGQACSESLGFDQVSSTGGQLDFVRNARYSKNGKSILMLPSTFKDAEGNTQSRITTTLLPGAVVTTPRSDIQYVATEYGCVYLWGKSANERAKLLISIAHPDFRSDLTALAKKEHLMI
jgi:4-hydroxybutyrate CoA-transferase